MKRIDVRKADTTHTAYVWRLALKVDAWYHGRFTQSIEYRYLKKHHCEATQITNPSQNKQESQHPLTRQRAANFRLLSNQ